MSRRPAKPLEVTAESPESRVQAEVVAIIRKAQGAADEPPWHDGSRRKNTRGFQDIDAHVRGRRVVVECKGVAGILSGEQLRRLHNAMDEGALVHIATPDTLDQLAARLGVSRETASPAPPAPPAISPSTGS